MHSDKSSSKNKYYFKIVLNHVNYAKNNITFSHIRTIMTVIMIVLFMYVPQLVLFLFLFLKKIKINEIQLLYKIKV